MTETRPWPIPQPGGLRLHQVTDTHAWYRGWSKDELDHMADDIIRVGMVPVPDAFIHTGDIVDGPSIATADFYMQTWMFSVARGAPSLWSMGNHDIRDRVPNTRAAWEGVYGRPANTYLDVGGYRLITFAVDQHSTGQQWTIPDATWMWLDEVIEAAPGPVILTQHYPPAELGMSVTDCVQPASRFDQLLVDHPNIVGMINGHMHWMMDDARHASMVEIGGRLIPVVTDISSMLSISSLSRDQSGQLGSISVFVDVKEAVWRLFYRDHGGHRWTGPGGLRCTVMDLASGTVSHSM